MTLRPLALGLTVASLAGCPKQELPRPLSNPPQEQSVEPATTLDVYFQSGTDTVNDRLQTFLAKLSESEGEVGPMTAEIQSFSEGEVTQGMMARYRSFLDQWWAYVNESNQTRAEGTSLILPANPTEDPIFTEMVVPIVRGIELTPVERRAVLEDYRFRTLKGVRTDMEQLFETELKPISPNVLRGDPQALTVFEAFKTDFDALEERFMLYQYVDFAQILGIEREQFDEVTTAQEEVVGYSKTLRIPKNLEEAAPLLEEVSSKLDEYQARLDQYDSSSAEYYDVLSAIMMLMELQTRLTSMVLDQVSTPDVTGATVVGDEFEMILKAPRTPLGRFDLEVTTSSWETKPDVSSGIYSEQWSKWAEWYSTAFYFLAMRHFDKQRATYTQQVLTISTHCESWGHNDCTEEPFDPLEAWASSLSFATQAMSDDLPISDLQRLSPTIPPIYLSTGVNFNFSENPITVWSHGGGEKIRLNIPDDDLDFPTYCKAVKNPYSFNPDGSTSYHSYGTSGSDEWHFPIVFKGFRSSESKKCETTYYDPRRYQYVTQEYICTDAMLPPQPGERRWFDRTDESLTGLRDLEIMTVGFCTAEQAFKPRIDETLGFSNLSEPRLYASCIADGCQGQAAENTFPTDFFEQLARETVARSWTDTAAMK